MSNVKHITNKELSADGVLSLEWVSVVKFGAEWCGPCRMLDGMLETYANEQSDVNVCIVDVDKSPDLAWAFWIRSVPMSFFFKDGKIVKTVQPVVWPEIAKIKEIADSLK